MSSMLTPAARDARVTELRSSPTVGEARSWLAVQGLSSRASSASSVRVVVAVRVVVVLRVSDAR